MRKAKAPRVPVLENAFEVSLPKLRRAVKETGDTRVVLNNGKMRAVAMLTMTRLAVFLGDRPWIVDIILVQCLKDRVRPLLKCPRAHEGNFQSLYYLNGELACRHCHALRYRTNVAGTAVERARIAQSKLLKAAGYESDFRHIIRKPFKWRKRHLRLLNRLAQLTNIHYDDVRSWLNR